MFWFTILLLLPYGALAQNYCSISPDHTMCKYQGAGPTCGSNKESGVSEVEIQQILKLHNDFRAKIALGMEKRGFPGPQPSAANMQALVWDDNLASVAQKWADQCTFQHDTYRNDPRFQVGQNMYFSSGFSKVNWTRAVSAWYEEVTSFNSRIVDSFQFNRIIGHYTQLAWGNTRYIGCGRTTYGGAYRLQGYQQMEYILSSLPQNESIVDNKNSNRKRTDVLLDHEYIPSKTPESVKIMEKLTKDTRIPENKEIHPSTTNQVSKRDNLRQSTTENIEQENEEIQLSQNVESQSPTFSIYIPGYWISKSQLDMKGPIAGTFQSLEFSGTADLNQFIKETPSNGVLETIPWYHGPLDFRKHPSRLQNNRLTQRGWVQNTYENLGKDQILVCNYGPTGNYLYQPVYVRGQPCSRCPSGSVCINGLCA